MQKRRVNSASSSLPVTMSDAAATKTSRTSRSERRTKRQNSKEGGVNKSCMMSFCLFFIVMGMVGFILMSDFDYVSHHPINSSTSKSASASTSASMGSREITDSMHWKEDKGQFHFDNVSLSKFKSLKYALANADIVGIYFAASWCPMSTPVSDKIESLFSSDSSPLQHQVLSIGDHDATAPKKDFALVYVSSDDNEKDMMGYSRKNWINVPFDSPDKEDIKRTFRICARIEMESLGIERRRKEIPSLVIIDSLTHGILSVNGEEDIMEYGKHVLDHWIQMKDLVRALEEKYLDEED
jgi:hypothetical protein